MPQSYGWTVLSAEHVQRIAQVPDNTAEACLLARYDRPIGGIVLEYFPEAQRLSHDSVTEKVADNALRGLYALHSAYVRHCDVDLRNILVLPGERVLSVDFIFAVCPCGGIKYLSATGVTVRAQQPVVDIVSSARKQKNPFISF